MAWLLAVVALVGFVGSDFHVFLEKPGTHEVGEELLSGELRADCGHETARHLESATRVERPECAVVGSLSQLRSLGERRVSVDLDRERELFDSKAVPGLASSSLDRSASPRGPPLG